MLFIDHLKRQLTCCPLTALDRLLLLALHLASIRRRNHEQAIKRFLFVDSNEARKGLSERPGGRRPLSPAVS
ncbi:MAG: hypothetical protein KatS3mg057_1459 [Herpetosiphonaceae bacterium]|nr:MAG: hypothetical protein KatS3mg057_1459 [Herpetosiphonaceae bacterium]